MQRSSVSREKRHSWRCVYVAVRLVANSRCADGVLPISISKVRCVGRGEVLNRLACPEFFTFSPHAGRHHALRRNIVPSLVVPTLPLRRVAAEVDLTPARRGIPVGVEEGSTAAPGEDLHAVGRPGNHRRVVSDVVSQAYRSAPAVGRRSSADPCWTGRTRPSHRSLGQRLRDTRSRHWRRGL